MWESETNYDYLKGRSAANWGWEFIRRDPDYIAEWKAASETYTYSTWDKLSGASLGLQAGDKLSRVAKNFVYPNEIDSYLIHGCDASKWGIRFYQHPEATRLIDENLLRGDFISRGDPSWCNPEDVMEDEFTITLPNNSLAAIINFLKPLSPQLEAIKAECERLRLAHDETKGKSTNPATILSNANKENLWVSYLRVVDARIAGCSRAIAAPIIFPGDRHVTTPQAKWDEAQKQVQDLRTRNFQWFMR